MRAQIEQVGKNVAACLKAVGAVPSDIVLTRTYVTDACSLMMARSGSPVLTTPRRARNDRIRWLSGSTG